jgi:hypothetical protein
VHHDVDAGFQETDREEAFREVLQSVAAFKSERRHGTGYHNRTPSRYYHEDRTHLGLGKGTPDGRTRTIFSLMCDLEGCTAGTIGLPNPNQRSVVKTSGFLDPYKRVLEKSRTNTLPRSASRAADPESAGNWTSSTVGSRSLELDRERRRCPTGCCPPNQTAEGWPR